MCLGNRAENSAFYINSQLKALWENAQRCTEHYGTNLKPVHNEIEFNTCLYEFYGPGRHDHGKPRKRDLHFYAKFGLPRLEFMCNHEVVLYLHLKEGHYKSNTHRPTAKGVPVHDIDNITLAFRLDFDHETLNSFECDKIGDKDYTMNLFILNMFTSTFLLECSDLKSIATAGSEAAFREKETRVEALVHWISRFYFPLLKRAGLHVYHSLPDFAHSNSILSSHVDYSATSSVRLATQEIAGVRVEDVNEYLKGLWLQAAAYTDEHPIGDEFDQNMHQYYLAEHKSSWAGEDCHFHMYFGPMSIRTLCRREVILYINIHELEARFGSGFSSNVTPYKLENWSVALIVDVYSESVEDNNVQRIKANLASVRSCGPLSQFPRGDTGTKTLDEKTFTRIKSSLERYITEHFVRLMQDSGHDCIYERDLRVVANPDSIPDEDHEGEQVEPEDDDSCSCTDINCPHTVVPPVVIENNRDQIKITDVDQVFSITQGAVNAHFHHLWQAASDSLAKFGDDLRSLENKKKESQFCIAEYFVMQETYGNEVFFNSSFSAPKVQLVLDSAPDASQRVIFYLHLKEGNMKTLGSHKKLVPEGEVHGFTNWRLAFHVNLQLIDCEDGDVDEEILKLTGRSSGKYFKRLVLDFETAKFDQKLSQVPGLLDGTDFRLIRNKREALIHYMQEYFTTLTRSKYHVICTIPVHDPSGQGNHPQIPEKIKVENYPFYVHPGQSPKEGISGKYKPIYDKNIIVIPGVKPGGKMPSGFLPRGITIGGGVGGQTYGTICLARDAFLRAQVLDVLANVNRQTTILPAFSGISRNQWDLKLTTWDKHHVKKDLDCTWRQVVKDTPGDLKFEWTNKDDWRYIHQGEMNYNGTFEVKCNTTNTLRIPVGRRHGLSRIPLEGRLEIELSYQGQGYAAASQSWSGKINVIWLAVIELISDSFNGVKVRLSPENVEPRFRELGPNNSIFQSVVSKLKDIFPSTIDFSQILSGLRSSFDGIHTQIYIGSRRTIACNPVFTQHGDLLLDIVPRGAESSSHHRNINGTTTYTLSALGKEVVVERNPPKQIVIPSPEFSPTGPSPYGNFSPGAMPNIHRSPSPQLPYPHTLPSPTPVPHAPRSTIPSTQPFRSNTPPLVRPNSRGPLVHDGRTRTPSPARGSMYGQPPSLPNQPQGHAYQTYQQPSQMNQARNSRTSRQLNPVYVGTIPTQAFLPHEMVQHPQLRQYMPGGDIPLTAHGGND